MNPIPKHPKKEMTLQLVRSRNLAIGLILLRRLQSLKSHRLQLSNDYFHTGAGARYLRREKDPSICHWKLSSGRTPPSKHGFHTNQPEWIAQRHGVANAEDTVTKMADLLNAISRTAVDPKP